METKLSFPMNRAVRCPPFRVFKGPSTLKRGHQTRWCHSWFPCAILQSWRLSTNRSDKRLAREGETMTAMVRCYCRDQHGAEVALCPECQGLLGYATVRLDRCRFGAAKPTCANCPVPCYQRDRREQMKAVMRHAGPRMLWRHPVLSFRHWLDGFRKVPWQNRQAMPAGDVESVSEKSRWVSTLQGAIPLQHAKAWTPNGCVPDGSDGKIISQRCP
jgi:hypothetical protein